VAYPQKKEDHNQYFVSTSLVQPHLHQPHDGHGVQIGRLPPIPNVGIMYEALGKALPDRGFDSGFCGGFCTT
jgi:hypothetical protein